MIPIRDTVRSRKISAVTLLIIASNVLVFLYQSVLGREGYAGFIYMYGFIPVRFIEHLFSTPGLDLTAFYPVLSGMFLHGSLFHLVSNMWILWLFGDSVEDRMGHLKFFVFYISCGIFATAAHTFFNLNSQVPAVGASGAIAGVMGAYLIMFPHARIVALVPVLFFPMRFNIPAVIYLLMWFISQLYSGAIHALAGGGAVGGIAWWAHVGGFIAGMFLHRYFYRKAPWFDPL